MRVTLISCSQVDLDANGLKWAGHNGGRLMGWLIVAKLVKCWQNRRCHSDC